MSRISRIDFAKPSDCDSLCRRAADQNRPLRLSQRHRALLGRRDDQWERQRQSPGVDRTQSARVDLRGQKLRIATDDPAWLRYLLIFTTIAFLTLFLFVPLAAVFTEALRKGFGAYFASFRDPAAISAIS